MSKTKADPALRKAMCNRLKRLLHFAYDDNWVQLATRMGYASGAGIGGLKKGTSFPDVQRLGQIANWPIEAEGRFVPSLHWIITGVGPAIVRLEGDLVVEGLPLEELNKRRTLTRKI